MRLGALGFSVEFNGSHNFNTPRPFEEGRGPILGIGRAREYPYRAGGSF